MDYRNFDLEAFDYRSSEAGEQYNVRVAGSPAGEQKLQDAEQVTIPGGLRRQLRRLDRRQLELTGLVELGELLAGMLFPPRARAFLTRSRERLDDGQGLRVRLKLDTFALADLPWEYAYIPRPDTPVDQKGMDGFLVLDRQISLVRYEVMGQAPASLDPLDGAELRLVALFANPDDPDFPPLNLDAEQQNLEAALQGAAGIRAELYPQARVETLEDAFTNEAHVFHFSGHGTFEGEMGLAFGSVEGKGYIVLLDEENRGRPFPADKLAQNLRGRGVRLAFLGACEASRRDQVNAWTGVAPALTRAGVPAVLGMQFTVRDDNAIAFSRRFYRALAAGQPVDAAVTDGRLAIFNRADESERDWGVPVLYLRTEAGVLFPEPGDGLPERDPGRRRVKPRRKLPVQPREAVEVQDLAGYERPLSDLIQQLSRGRLVLFIGSDLPADIAGLPSRQALADQLAEQEGLPPGQRLSAVAQQLMSHGNRRKFTDFLREGWETTDKELGPFYRSVAGLVKASQPELIITTAPHRMLEWSLRDVGDLTFNNVARDNALPFADPNRPTLLKLYGDLDQPDTLIVTEQDQNALSRGRLNPDMVDEVRRAFRRSSVLFLGHDLSDPAVNALFDEVAGDRFQASAYAVWTGLTTQEMESFRSNRGLDILPVDPLAVVQALLEGD